MKNQRLYFLSLVLIGLLEIPLNGTTFIPMDGSTTEQMLMVLTLAVGLPVAAHFAGRAWKRRAENRRNRWIAIVTTVYIVGLCVLLGELRESYLMEFGISSPAEAQISALLMVVISVLLYGVGTILAYSAHDSNPDMEEVVQTEV
jgi:hypothetical protein